MFKLVIEAKMPLISIFDRKQTSKQSTDSAHDFHANLAKETGCATSKQTVIVANESDLNQ